MTGPLGPGSDSQHPSAGASLDSFEVVDPVARSAYVARFDADVAALSPRKSSQAALLRAAAASRVVLLGEYHALDSACRTARWLIEQLAKQRRAVLLGLEMVHARDQRALDDYQSGRGGDALLQQRMRYREEWGYPWSGPKALLRRAARVNVPAYGLDMPPRGGVEDLELRDEAAAERLAHRLTLAGPNSLAIVVFGEAHLAEPHLPALLRQRLGGEATVLLVLHDVDHPKASADGVSVSGRTFIVQRRPFAARERALARTYRTWAADPPEQDDLNWDSTFHGLLNHATGVVGIDPRRERIAGGARLVDSFPEVVADSDSPRWAAVLNHSSIAQRGGRATAPVTLIGTWNWMPEAHAVLATRLDFRAAAIEAGRFAAAHLRVASGAQMGSPRNAYGRVVEYSVATAIVAWTDVGLRRLGPSALSDRWLPRYPASTRVKRSEATVHRSLTRGGSLATLLSRLEPSDQAPVERLLAHRYGVALARQRSKGGVSLASIVGLARMPLGTEAQDIAAFKAVQRLLRPRPRK